MTLTLHKIQVRYMVGCSDVHAIHLCLLVFLQR